MLGVLANIYAVLIAFVIVQGWTNLQEAQTFVDSQATALTEIRENTQGARPARRRGRSRPRSTATPARSCATTSRRWRTTGGAARSRPQKLEQLFKTVRRCHPKGAAQTVFYDQTVERLDNIVSARQSAVTASDG